MKLTESNSVNLDSGKSESAVAPGECGSVPALPNQGYWEWLIGRTFSLGEVIDVCDETATVRRGDGQFRILVCELLYEHFKDAGLGMQPPNNQPNSDHVAVIGAEPESSVPDGFLPMESAPLDGTEILLLTKIGIVSAWFAKGEWTEHHENGREYTGPAWVCYDDKFQIEVEETERGNFSEAIGWMPKPGQSGVSPPNTAGQPNEQNAVITDDALYNAATEAWSTQTDYRWSSSGLSAAITAVRDMLVGSQEGK